MTGEIDALIAFVVIPGAWVLMWAFYKWVDAVL